MKNIYKPVVIVIAVALLSAAHALAQSCDSPGVRVSSPSPSSWNTANPISGTMTAQVWNPSDCPGCVDYVTVGIRDSAGNWVGGEPQVIVASVIAATCSPGNSYPGSAFSALAVPTPPGNYTVWAELSLSLNSSDAISTFKSRHPTAETELERVVGSLTVSVLSRSSLYYQCNQTNGTIVVDSKGSNNGALDNGNVYFNYSTDLGRYCLKKLDDNQAGITPSSCPVSNSTFTVSCWAKPTSENPSVSWQFFMMNQSAYSAEKTYRMGTSNINYMLSNGSDFPQRTAYFTANWRWHHYVWVNQNNGNGTANLRMYVDGVKLYDGQLAASEYSSTVGANQKFLVQRPYSLLYYQFIGELCNIATFDNVALNDSDVAQLFNETYPLRPQLGSKLAANEIIISWPTNVPSFFLEWTTNLTVASWISNSDSPVIVSGQNVVTNSITGQSKFYRLKK